MRAPELVEFAALVSAHGPALIHCQSELSAAGLAQYWAASRCRLDRWGWALKGCSLTQAASPPKASHGHSLPVSERASESQPHGHLKCVLEEVLATEVLTRVWTGVLAARDRRRGTCDAAPIAESVLGGHVEARNRALKFLAHGPGVTSHDALVLNRLRRRSERWTDLLLGHLTTFDDVSQWAFQPAVAREFAAELRGQSAWAAGGQAWTLVLASLRAGFRRDFALTSPNADLNAQIISAILGCFPPELFDSTGLVQTLWMSRLTSAATDVQGLIAELFPAPRESPADAAGFFIRTRRHQR